MKQQLAFRIHGLDCAEEVAVLKRELGPLVGEANLAFDILNAKMVVADSATSPDMIREAVARTGMKAEPWRETVGPSESSFWSRHRRELLTSGSGLAILLGLVLHADSDGLRVVFLESSEQTIPLATRVLYIFASIGGLWLVLPKAWLALRRFRPDMNLLMVVAVIGAIVIGEWLEAATVAFLFALSLTLEAWSVGRARRAVAALLALAPPEVRVVRADGSEETVRPEDVGIGSQFRVRPGDRIPLDGLVRAGSGGVDQAPITGESIPVPKSPGDEVFAGTINGDGVLLVEATKRASDTTLARITRMVGEAQTRRAPSEQWVERFAQYYTPVVMVLALLVLLVPPLFLGGAWSAWLYRALILLVIACPCALVIATPVSIVAALASAARNGVLVKGGLYIEVPAKLRALAFDKTGTLTQGKPDVIEVLALQGHTEDELLERVAALEAHSTHPLARAITAYALAKNVAVPAVSEYRNLPGQGALGIVNGRLYWVGSHKYLETRGQETAAIHEQLETFTQQGKAVVVVGTEEHVCGFITLADAVRPEAKAALAALREQGVQHLVMLTGDNRGTAAAIATETGVDAFDAELLPADKVARIEELLAKYGTVGMIGDGVNDAPALARASVAIAMGAMGADAALETADIALMTDDLTKLPWLVQHSRRTLAIIQQNLVFALGVKAVFALLTLTNYATMWAAVAADSGATLLVVFNALRLLRIEPAGRRS